MKYKLALPKDAQWMRDRGTDSLYRDFGKKTFTEEEAMASLGKTGPWTIWINAETNFQSMLAKGYIIPAPDMSFRTFFRNLLARFKKAEVRAAHGD